MISVVRYSEEKESIWNDFNKKAKNSLFMFDRNYMGYHSDRFIDHSLLFYNDDKLVALLPMCEKENTLVSHGGLTYGGIISDEKMKQHTMNDCFDEVVKYMQKNGFSTMIYKTIPHIYHSQPAEEDKFALFANGASLTTVDVSTYINLRNPLSMPKGRKAQISRARREGVVVEELKNLRDYIDFIQLENEVLETRHDTKAVHTGDELKMLQERFPDNIHLFGAIKEKKMIAGAVVFEYDQVIHTQYMAANDEARVIGALDLTIHSIIEHYKSEKMWLDFGISTERGRIYLNEGLVAQKEGFGGRTGCYEVWELSI